MWNQMQKYLFIRYYTFVGSGKTEGSVRIIGIKILKWNQKFERVFISG